MNSSLASLNEASLPAYSPKQAGRTCLQFLEQADAVHLVHAQVGDDEIGTKTMQGAKRFVRALDSLDFEVFGAKANTQEAKKARVVVDEQDLAFGLCCCRSQRYLPIHHRR